MPRRFPIFAGVLLILFRVPAAGTEGYAFFENAVRPILVERCYSCHSEESGKRKGGLWLDRRSGWEAGGDSGPAIVPGEPDQSSFFHAVRYLDENLQMPPKSKLPEDELAILERWIAMGAPDPRDAALAGAVRRGGIDYEAARKGWAFRPLEPRGWSVDRHVEAGLSEAGLEPVPLAGPRERLRRIHHDLTGLPPTEAEVEKFAADPSPEAWERVIDELLARPGFGEKWGRHWLDVARYADSNGGDRNFTFYQAWRYRDYVIDAFNRDKPYYDFVREQLAGDLLPWSTPGQRREQLIGSTFLALGPKMLTERDKEKLRMDVADEQLDTLGRAFLGLTLGCARCHDHKFDPVSQEDYYAMAGMMRSTQVVLGTRNGCVNVASWVEQALPGASEATRAKLERMELAMRLTVEKLYREKTGNRPVSMNLPLSGVIIDNADAELVGEWETSTYLPRRVGEDYLHDKREGKGEKRAIFRASLPENGEYEVRVSYNADDRRARRVPVRIEARQIHGAELDQTVTPEIARLFQPVGRFHFEKGGRANVVISTGRTEGYVIVDAVQFISVADLEREEMALAAMEGETVPGQDLLAMTRKELNKEVEKMIKELRDAEVAMAPRDAADAGDIPLRVRGVVSQHGPVVERRFLRVLDPGNSTLVPEGGSGRRELALWITAEDNALLDRVLVNRAWHHLMGQGIVRSVDNFGALGDAPSHPELLDDLAAAFRASGGSIKALVRTIARSRTYQRGSRAGAALAAADPENRLLGRQNRPRLSAEELRDSLLFVAGGLERGRPGATSNAYGQDLDKSMDLAGKVFRAVYLPVARNNSVAELTIFDMANPDLVSGARPATTVPTQALYLLNGKFVARQALTLARLARQEAELPEGQVEWLYRRIFQREPTGPERDRAGEFIVALGEETGSAEATLGHFAHVLLGSTEFQFLD